MKLALILIVTFIFSNFSFAGARIDKISNQLNTSLQCTNRIWPGLKKESYRILFAQPSTTLSWLWTEEILEILKS